MDLVERAVRFDRRLVERGWTFDTEYSSDDGFASWCYAPSATELADESLETVTRFWFTIVESQVRDDGDFPDSVRDLVRIGRNRRQ